MVKFYFQCCGPSVEYTVTTLIVLAVVMCRSDVSNTTEVTGGINVSAVLQSREFCQLETFQANCSGVVTGGNSPRSRTRSVDVIYMQSAHYGRMQIGRCVTRDYGHVGCAVDVLSEVDALCSGRLKTCQFPVARLHSAAAGGGKFAPAPHAELKATPTPCPADLTSYLDASFVCLPVITASSHQACRAHLPLVVTSSFGYLASAVTIATGQGGRDCPWRVQLPSGQRINVTLVNFFTAGGAWLDSVQTTPSGGAAGGRSSVTTNQPVFRPNACYQLAVFREGMDSTEVTRTLTECEGGPRISHAYMSESNVVDVEIQVSRNQLHRKLYFLLQFNAVGCASTVLSESGLTLLRRDADEARVQCNSTKSEWTLYCRGTTWTRDSSATESQTDAQVAVSDYCSLSVSVPEPASSLSNSGRSGSVKMTSAAVHLANIDRANFPYGILAVVTIGVALGVVVGGVLLICSAKHFRRYQDAIRTTSIEYYGSTEQHSNHYDRTMMTAPMTTVVNGNGAGDVTSKMVLTPDIFSTRRQPSFAVVTSSSSSVSATPNNPHAVVTALQYDNTCRRHRCHDVMMLSNDDPSRHQHESIVDLKSGSSPSHVTRVVRYGGSVRRVEPVSPRRILCDSL